MRLIKILSALIILILILLFLLKNNDIVAIDLIIKQYKNVSVSVVMVSSIGIGLLIGYGVAVLSVLSAKADVRDLNTELRTMKNELNDLRNVAIEEEIEDE